VPGEKKNQRTGQTARVSGRTRPFGRAGRYTAVALFFRAIEVISSCSENGTQSWRRQWHVKIPDMNSAPPRPAACSLVSCPTRAGDRCGRLTLVVSVGPWATGHRPSTLEPPRIGSPSPFDPSYRWARSRSTEEPTRVFSPRALEISNFPLPSCRRPLAAVPISSPAPAAARAQNCGGATYGGTQ
jgi:hypothetical protein